MHVSCIWNNTTLVSSVSPSESGRHKDYFLTVAGILWFMLAFLSVRNQKTICIFSVKMEMYVY